MRPQEAKATFQYATEDEAARSFMVNLGMTPTNDALDQLMEVFVPCLRIMCERPWDPNGGTWRQSGQLGVLTDLRKKFERVWYKYWMQRKSHPDSILDMINYAGFVMRSKGGNWGEWGEPGSVDGS